MTILLRHKRKQSFPPIRDWMENTYILGFFGEKPGLAGKGSERAIEKSLASLLIFMR